MNKTILIFIRPLLAFILAMGFFIYANAQADPDLLAAFTKRVAANTEMSEAQISTILNNAKFQQSIIDKMDSPAEGTMTWERYRRIFIKEDRIAVGVQFWQDNEPVLNEVSFETGVPIEIIVGILGVETFFGQRIGSYRVLDALYTLAFGYPKRSNFFSSELEKFFELAEKENLDIYSLKGSYAGAIGYAQFMPSSYLAYAKSYEVDGSRNLMEVNDAIASVANYLKSHRWVRNGIITLPIDSIATSNPESSSLKPSKSLAEWSELGYIPSGNIAPSLKASVIGLTKENESLEYWFGFENFYVITRYNHSPLYAMAVYQLGEELKREYSK
jgi:membrane-bound lytic murein transglycosylase B